MQDTLGITGAQLFVLQQLAEAPGASLRELADRTLTDQSSVSVVVSRLVAARHIARRTSAVDARRTELRLTVRGQALLHQAPPLVQTRLVAALRAVPAAQLQVAARVLGGAARAVSSPAEPAPMFFEPPTPGRRARAGSRQRTARRGKGRLS
ncbi:MAG TPA: MarR family transcriptional regulator [Kofleriaceae bacterium]|nr:MarR family transcriptional regulator [Kofleriaceae bacterium]